MRQGLKEAGFVEGENVTIEYRWGEDRTERVPDLAADLVRRRVAVIATTGREFAAFAVKAADVFLVLRARELIGEILTILCHPRHSRIGLETG